MLRRNVALVLSSLGLGIVSILAFGLLFGNGGNVTPQLGVVDEDQTPLTTQMIQSLAHSTTVHISIGSRATEIDALRGAHLNAVIIMPAGFTAALMGGNAQMPVYYDQSNPTSWLIAQVTVQQVVQQLSGVHLPITLQTQAISVHNLRTIDFLTPGMIGMMLMWANLGIGTILVSWRQVGIMRRLAATPLRPGILIAAQMSARLLLSLIQAAMLLVIAMTVFKVPVYGNLGLLAGVVTLGTLTMLAIGFIIGGLTAKPEVANAITFLISFPMMFLGGSYFSVDNAPAFMRPVTQFLPLTHLNDALRQIINNGASFAAIQNDVFVLIAWIVLGSLVATRAFRWV